MKMRIKVKSQKKTNTSIDSQNTTSKSQTPNKHIESFECPNCCETYKIGTKNKKIRCGNCEYETCNHCQKRYAKSECMSCHSDFTKNQIETLLGKQYVQDVIIRQQIDDMIIDEKKLIPATEELIDYYKEVERRKKLFRKGQQAFEELPPKPMIVSRTIITPCSITDCKGYLRTNISTNVYECMLCAKQHCPNCLVSVVNTETHECDKDTLETIKQLDIDTKPCPKCYTRIYKTEGCDHMRCTSCGSHFSWVTGVMLNTSTNHHYDNNIRNQGTNNNGICIHDYKVPAIPQDVLSPKLTEELIFDLYTYPNKIRIYYNTDCNYETIINKKMESNNDLRIRYMKNEITEKYWGQRLYKNNKTMKMRIAHHDIIEMYLSGIDSLQSKYYNMESGDPNEIHREVVELIRQCNCCFESVNDEYYCETSETRFQLAMPENAKEGDVLLEKKVIQKTKKTKKTNNKYDEIWNEEQIKPVELFDYQEEHYNRIKYILEKYKVGFDLSELGAGKTYITCKYLQEHKYENNYVVCPAALKLKWQSVANEYGIRLTVLTYNEVASVRMKQPNHGLLIRDDFMETQVVHTSWTNNDDTREIQKVKFYATEKLIELAKKPKGIFVAFDEIQNIKNENSNVTHACREIMNEIYNNAENPILCISGTPVDKQQQFITIFRNIGIQRDNALYRMNLSNWQNEPTGILEIVDYCEKIARMENNANAIEYMMSVRANMPRNKVTATGVLYRIFLEVIRPILTSIMTIPAQPMARIVSQNIFYDLEGEDLDIAEKAIKKMLEIVDNSNGIFGEARIQLFKSMILLESAKINTMIQEAEYILTSDPNKKVVIAVSYSESVRELMEKMAGWNPLCVNGEINGKTKQERIEKFQEANIERRLLIGNINVISTGIDLDDKDGRYAREVLVSPTFSEITMHQLKYRFRRSVRTKSETLIKNIYTTVGMPMSLSMSNINTERYVEMEVVKSRENIEMRIMEGLKKKSKIIGAVVGKEVEEIRQYRGNLRFP